MVENSTFFLNEGAISGILLQQQKADKHGTFVPSRDKGLQVKIMTEEAPVCGGLQADSLGSPI